MAYRWRHCALTQERLQEPIVMCGLGRLYSKQNIIEQLLDKEKEMPESCKHIKSLRDVRDLVLTPNPIYKDEDKTEGLLDTRSAPYICKLIGLEMSGKFRFIGLWSCGCVFSERAIKEIGSNVCALCQTPFTEQDIVTLNGNEEEVDRMTVKMEARSARRKADKKSKSKKNVTVTTATSESVVVKTEVTEERRSSSNSSGENDGDMLKPEVCTKIIKTELIKTEKDLKVVSKIGEKPGTSTSLGKKPNPSISQQSLKRNADTKDALLDPEMKKLKEGGAFSVASDPKASSVYKSLFTSHESAQQQDRAHWVTYNPFYN